MKTDVKASESRSAEMMSDEFMRILAAMFHHVQTNPFGPQPLSAPAQAAVHAYERICSSLDHENPPANAGLIRK